MKKKEKIKLPNGLTIICFDEENHHDKTAKVFECMSIKDGKKEVLYLSKLKSVNGTAVKGFNWGY